MLVDINNPDHTATYKEAIEQPIPSPNSLWIPVHFEKFSNIHKDTKFDIACKVAISFLRTELSEKTICKIINDAFTFDAPLFQLSKNKNIFICELTHGPTHAFKDFGARFSVYVTQALCKGGTIAAATSGDTGGAIISACEECNYNSLIFYPHNRISDYQRMQITNSNFKNTVPVAVEGSFDDCQSAIKECLAMTPNLYSGNSVNILRLIAQVIYYF